MRLSGAKIRCTVASASPLSLSFRMSASMSEGRSRSSWIAPNGSGSRWWMHSIL